MVASAMRCRPLVSCDTRIGELPKRVRQVAVWRCGSTASISMKRPSHPWPGSQNVHSAILSSDRDNHSITGRFVLDLLSAGEHVLAHMRKYHTFGSDFRQMLRKCRVIQMEFHLPVVELTFSDKEVGALRSLGKGVHPFGVT
jgi:hypothetical protein